MNTNLPLITAIALAVGGLSLARVLAQETIFDPRKPITIADDAPKNPLQPPANAQQGEPGKSAYPLRAPANDIGPRRAPANDLGGPLRAPGKAIAPAHTPAAGPAPPIAMLGIVLDTEADDAVIVADVQANSPAARAGVRAGDIIAGVDGTPVLNPDELHDVIAELPAGKPIDLAITRTTHVQVAPVADQFQTGQQQVTPAVPATPAPPAVAPAPVRPVVPAAPQREYRRGIFRRR